MTTPSHEPASYKAIDRFVQRISANIEDELSEYANTKDHINSACAEHVAALEKEKRALQDEIHNANYRMRQLEETRAQTLAKQRDTHKASFHDVLRSASDYLAYYQASLDKSSSFAAMESGLQILLNFQATESDLGRNALLSSGEELSKQSTMVREASMPSGRHRPERAPYGAAKEAVQMTSSTVVHKNVATRRDRKNLRRQLRNQPYQDSRNNAEPLTDLVVGGVYSAYWKPTNSYYAVIVLPAGSFESVGISGSIFDTSLVDYIPVCYQWVKQPKSIVGWADGYDTNQPKVKNRKYPVLYLEGDFTISLEGQLVIPNRPVLGWVAIKDMRTLDLKDPEACQIIGYRAALAFSRRTQPLKKPPAKKIPSVPDEQDYIEVQPLPSHTLTEENLHIESNGGPLLITSLAAAEVQGQEPIDCRISEPVLPSQVLIREPKLVLFDSLSTIELHNGRTNQDNLSSHHTFQDSEREAKMHTRLSPSDQYHHHSPSVIVRNSAAATIAQMSGLIDVDECSIVSSIDSVQPEPILQEQGRPQQISPVQEQGDEEGTEYRGPWSEEDCRIVTNSPVLMPANGSLTKVMQQATGTQDLEVDSTRHSSHTMKSPQPCDNLSDNLEDRRGTTDYLSRRYHTSTDTAIISLPPLATITRPLEELGLIPKRTAATIATDCEGGTISSEYQSPHVALGNNSTASLYKSYLYANAARGRSTHKVVNSQNFLTFEAPMPMEGWTYVTSNLSLQRRWDPSYKAQQRVGYGLPGVRSFQG